MNISVLGIGLIGGSMALALRESKYADRITGIENNQAHAQKALELGLVDEVLNMEEALEQTDLLIVAVPVSTGEKLIKNVLDRADRQIIMDVGSTKMAICEEAGKSRNRGRFVATHPMWGTEFSGPEASVKGAFQGNAVVLCDTDQSDVDALEKVMEIYGILQMKPVFMNAEVHDVHAAYVSHISHITSFALANTVLEKEREEEAIFDMASAGFESTVRLAKSNPKMWLPIFQQNRENVLDVLNEHISQLRKFKSCLEKENYEYLAELMENANKIKRIIH